MTRQSFRVPAGLRWDEVAARRFMENAPYYLEGAQVVGIEGRDVEVEITGGVDVPRMQSACEALASRISGELRDSAEELVTEFQVAPQEPRPDPMPTLLASGDVVRTGRGRFAYGGRFLRILEALDRRIADYAAERGAESRLYPVTVNAATLLRSGYLKTFPQHAYFVAAAGYSCASLEGIAKAGDVTDLASPGAREWFGAHDQVLAPTVCYHCFESLQGARLEGARSFTAMNHCSRFEVDGDTDLARLHTFLMRELISFGDAHSVAAMLDHALEWTTGMLRRWGIPHRVCTATDPFFAGAQSGKTFFQATFALKRELRLPLPYTGRWLAVGSFNNHQQSFTRAFDIGAPMPLASGCVGWGHERLALALLANAGCEPADWPAAMRADLAVD